MKKQAIEKPVYLFAGFLESGKTQFINSILADGFAAEDRTLLLCCEEGELEYDPKVLKNVTVVNVEDLDDIDRDFFDNLERKYDPEQQRSTVRSSLAKPSFRMELMNWVLPDSRKPAKR